MKQVPLSFLRYYYVIDDEDLLLKAGYTRDPQDCHFELGDDIYGMGYILVGWLVAKGEYRKKLDNAYLDLLYIGMERKTGKLFPIQEYGPMSDIVEIEKVVDAIVE